jgi:hypothetical protein
MCYNAPASEEKIMDEFEQAARDNIDRHLGDVCDPDDDPSVIEDNVYVLAHDAVVDAGASMEVARLVATKISREMAG